MLPDRVSNPGPLTYESGGLPVALRDPALKYFDQSRSLINRTFEKVFAIATVFQEFILIVKYCPFTCWFT